MPETGGKHRRADSTPEHPPQSRYSLFAAARISYALTVLSNNPQQAEAITREVFTHPQLNKALEVVETEINSDPRTQKIPDLNVLMHTPYSDVDTGITEEHLPDMIFIGARLAELNRSPQQAARIIGLLIENNTQIPEIANIFTIADTQEEVSQRLTDWQKTIAQVAPHPLRR